MIKNALTITIIIVIAMSIISYNIVSSVDAQNATTTRNDNNATKINVEVEGNNYQVRYNITNAKVVSIVPQKEATKLIVTIEPINSGKLTIDLPRSLIDYKIAASKDGSYIVAINGKQISSFKEISNTPVSRTLEIGFGGGDRTIEITGTQMAQAPVSAVKAQLTATAAASFHHAKSNTSGPINTFVNKTVGFLSNISGGLKKVLPGK